MPLTPAPLTPSTDRPRMITLSLAPAATTIALPADTWAKPKAPEQSSVIAWLIFIAPKPPGSRQSISPPAVVLESAPANVRHGAVRVQGLESFPTPDTQDWDCA